MLTKQPISKLKRYLGITAAAVVVAEGLGVAITYGLWYKLNTERDFRLHMKKNYNWVLETYYSVGEYLGNQNTRELDQKVWTSEGKINLGEMNIAVRATFWVVSFGALGYGLFKVVKPDDELLKQVIT